MPHDTMNQATQTLIQYVILIVIFIIIYLKISGNTMADTIRKIKELIGDLNGRR